MSKRKTGRNPARTTSRSAARKVDTSSARKKLQNNANVLDSLKALASRCINTSKFDEAENLLERAMETNPRDPDVLVMLAKVHINMGRYSEAMKALEPVFAEERNIPGAHFLASYALYHLHNFEQALQHISKALMLNPYEQEYLFHKATTLMALNRYSDALVLFERLLAQNPDNFVYLNNAGNLYRDLGELEKAQELFQRGMKLTRDNSYPYSNYLTTLHYDPSKTQEEIYRVCLEWEPRFLSNQKSTRPTPADTRAEKRLHVGMISDGFRNHPVGQMIIAALEHLPEHAVALTCYSSSSQADHITRRFEKLGEYKVVTHLSDEALTEMILEDEIDILFDLAGHNSGTRMKVMARQPSPILVKWVGGLINTTGLSSIDYLISDFIESPEGDDCFYTEKLIRMPGDYICYEIPPYAPNVSSLPAKSNGYITLGCFNNPMKLNPVLLEQWALIMRELPDSQLFLKGHQYSSEELCQRIIKTLEQHGIESSRVTLEGSAQHHKLLECYNRVDIALDPWPYSGGLTTCEAFVMGVPVVTMPGPTFAGRHSATHLVNAGMPELVTHSWDEYRSRVLELASDLDSLATIRSHLRTTLLQSPVCNADTFAGHLNNALRAIWQRYCEGKQPEALSFTPTGEVLFADETEPMQLQHPEPPDNHEESEFKWEFEGKVIAIDHGGQLMDLPVVRQMLDLGTLELIEFDPASNYLKHPLREHNSLYYYPNIALGNGQQATLYACQAPEQSGTLKPAPHEYMPDKIQQDLNILAELPIGTVALDKVNELPSVDWLVLDDLNDATAILENGTNTLKDTLILQTKVAFRTTHTRQSNFTEVSHWAARHGFRFYSIINNIKFSHFDTLENNILEEASELEKSDVIFIPDYDRLSHIHIGKIKKLSFILNTVYGFKDLAYKLLKNIDEFYSAEFIRTLIRKNKASIKTIKINPAVKNEALIKTNKKHPDAKNKKIIPVIDVQKI